MARTPPANLRIDRKAFSVGSLTEPSKEFLKLLNENRVRVLHRGICSWTISPGKQDYTNGHPPVRLEISTGISGVEFEDCYASRIADTLDGVEVNIMDLPPLKTNKKAAGRLKDLDVTNISMSRRRRDLQFLFRFWPGQIAQSILTVQDELKGKSEAFCGNMDHFDALARLGSLRDEFLYPVFRPLNEIQIQVVPASSGLSASG